MYFSLSNELDYSLLSLESRKNKVEDILSKYNLNIINHCENHLNVNLSQNDKTSENDVMTKDLEKIADYLLYIDNLEEREKLKKEKLFINKRTNEKRKGKEFLTENEDISEQYKRKKNNISNYGKIKVCEQDRKEHQELMDTGKMISILKKKIISKVDSNGNPLSQEQLKKLRWFLIEIRKDEVAIKEQLKKYINFKNITPSFPFYNLTNFSFSNNLHVKTLFDSYSLLKENTINKMEDDFKFLLFIFDDLSKKAIKEPILKKVFELKINGLSQRDIIEHINTMFQITISPVRLTQLTTNIIPSLIVQKYKEEFEEWIFTYKTKGNYKQCTSCKENKLANNKNFTIDSSRIDSLFPICKSCRKRKN